MKKKHEIWTKFANDPEYLCIDLEHAKCSTVDDLYSSLFKFAVDKKGVGIL